MFRNTFVFDIRFYFLSSIDKTLSDNIMVTPITSYTYIYMYKKVLNQGKVAQKNICLKLST